MPLSPKIAMAHASHLRGHGTEVKTTGAAVAAADGTPSKKALPAQETSSVGWLRPAPGPAKPQHTLPSPCELKTRPHSNWLCAAEVLPWHWARGAS